MADKLLIEEIKTGIKPPDAFDRFESRRLPFFLDSGMDPHKLGHYSFIGSDPFLILKSYGSDITLDRGGAVEKLKGSPLDTLQNLLEEYHLDYKNTPVPFTGGAVGYMSYDLRHFIEKLPTNAIDDLKLPECYLCFYDCILAFDNLEGRAYIISTGFPEKDNKKREKRAQERLAEMKAVISSDNSFRQPIKSAKKAEIESGFSKQQYIDAVEKARQYIIEGDIFEVNLSQRFEADIDITSYELYRRLRHINPAPFACYLGFDEAAVLSASPERFLKKQGDYVETRPIKGTRRRGSTPQQDEALADELLGSAKDMAENIMIVDLERNDLGRVCRYGTVKVTELAILEVYPTVFHLTSTVTGRLEDGKSCIDLLKATFPGGSITGAPKVRAMQIIDELEPTCRSVYTGAIGYIGFNGDMDLNIAIRTMLVKGNRVYFQAGGAVVYDSKPEAEYEETLHKARALMQSLGGD